MCLSVYARTVQSASRRNSRYLKETTPLYGPSREPRMILSANCCTAEDKPEQLKLHLNALPTVLQTNKWAGHHGTPLPGKAAPPEPASLCTIAPRQHRDGVRGHPCWGGGRRSAPLPLPTTYLQSTVDSAVPSTHLFSVGNYDLPVLTTSSPRRWRRLTYKWNQNRSRMSIRSSGTLS